MFLTQSLIFSVLVLLCLDMQNKLQITDIIKQSCNTNHNI